jgi:hypothetical protein
MNLKPLSLKQADRCEQAREPVCKCRCGGALHGAKRGDGRAFFESLPADDPHYLPNADVRAKQKSDRQAAKRREREAAMQRRFDALGAVRGRYDD